MKLFIYFLLVSRDTFLNARRDLILKIVPLACRILLFYITGVGLPPMWYNTARKIFMRINLHYLPTAQIYLSQFVFEFWNISWLPNSLYIIGSVSYTHLDVYKRQLQYIKRYLNIDILKHINWLSSLEMRFFFNTIISIIEYLVSKDVYSINLTA